MPPKVVLTQAECDKKNKDYKESTNKCVKKCGPTHVRDQASFKCKKSSDTGSRKAKKTRKTKTSKIKPSGSQPKAKTNQLSLSNMLKNVCSESNQCIMFGKEIDDIFVFFEKFENPSLIKTITPIGKTSVNGFIREVLYEKHNYTYDFRNTLRPIFCPIFFLAGNFADINIKL